MKFFFLYLVFSALFVGYGQSVENMPEDTATVMKLLVSANLYDFSKADSGLILSQKALAMARKLHFRRGEAEALHLCGESYHMLGEFPKALEMQFEALAINKELNDKDAEAETLSYIGIIYIQLGEYREALEYLMPGEQLAQDLPGYLNSSFIYSNIGDAYDFLKMPDSALYYQLKAYEHCYELPRPHARSFILRHMGKIYAELGRTDSALKFYRAAILNSHRSNDKINMSMVQNQISELFRSVHEDDSSLYYAHDAFINAQDANAKVQVLDASNLLAAKYRKNNNPDSAFFYMDIAAAIKDSLFGPEKFRQLQLLMLQEQKHQQAILQREEQLRNRIKYIVLISVLTVFLLLAFILLRNNRVKQKANSLLKEQKNKVEQTLTELKSTQAQLIQREKMASLGELTAGIAHEIQNPLNFVNNFSDVNKELIDELSIEADKGNISEVKGIAKDIRDNEEKINHHGKRADAIVKGMLQHSRSSAGIKEPTNINALAGEYLRLAQLGFLAKDKDFNVVTETDFDGNIHPINIIPQDIGRVLLNLYNNAFYTAFAKATTDQAVKGRYNPIVIVTTKKIADKVEISVRDNGNGISKNIIDKIFQPFFTTKPTGQGTGLGLSLSYDIIKAQGGEINVKSVEGEGSEFIVIFPL